MTATDRILLVRLSHLGDVVHALPVFHALREGYPGAEIAWAVQHEFAELVEGLPGLDRTIRFDRRGGPRAWVALHAELARFHADWAIDAQGNTKSSWITLMSGAGRRSGYHPAQWREPFGALGMTDAAERAHGSAPNGSSSAVPSHAIDRALALARHVAPHLGSRPLRTDPALSESECASGRTQLAAALGPLEQPPVLIHLGVPTDIRTWPAEHVVALAKRLASEGTPTLILSGPAEEQTGTAVESALADTPVRHLVGQRGLRQLAALFRAAAEHDAQLVACDSGPMHLAAACGLAVTALAGPQDVRRTGPWPVPHTAEASARGLDHRVVLAEEAPACAPCLARRCRHTGGNVCMSELSPERVLERLSTRRRLGGVRA